jgi:hypothetical protein
MNLYELILHAKYIVNSYKYITPNYDCAKQYEQLVEWLKELKVYRNEEIMSEYKYSITKIYIKKMF